MRCVGPGGRASCSSALWSLVFIAFETLLFDLRLLLDVDGGFLCLHEEIVKLLLKFTVPQLLLSLDFRRDRFLILARDSRIELSSSEEIRPVADPKVDLKFIETVQRYVELCVLKSGLASICDRLNFAQPATSIESSIWRLCLSKRPVHLNAVVLTYLSRTLG